VKLTIVKTEFRWVWGFAAFVALLTTAPYIYAGFSSPSTFTGFFIGVEDGNSYIAKMLLGANGAWLFRSPYTTADQIGALLYTPYLLLGKLLGTAATHFSYVVAFHAFRIGAIVALCFASYSFFALLVRRVALRRLGLAVATLGGGLGWLLLMLGRSDWWGALPLDFYSPEAFGYLAVFGLPHLALVRALLLYGLVLYLTRGMKSRPWLISLLWLALALTHLLTAGLGLLLIALHLVGLFVGKANDWRVYLAPAVWSAIGAGPVFAYNAWALWRDSYLRTWAAQNQIISPNPLHFIIAYGWLLLFAYFGARALWKNSAGLFFAVWLFSLPVLLYLPLGLQRRLAEGAWVLVLGLALHYLDSQKWERIKPQLWLFILALPSTLVLYLGVWQAALHPAEPVFLYAGEVSAFSALRRLAPPSAVVLSAYETGNALPAWVPVRVVIGHGPETAHLSSLMNRVENFYEPSTTDEFRIDLLRNNDVEFVVRGPAELLLGRWDPDEASYLELVYESDEYQIFRVALP
jgi:hypothetical protein